MPTSPQSNSDSDCSTLPEVHLDEGSLWYATGRQILHYDTSTLDLIADHSELIAEEESLMAVHRRNGVLIAVTDRPEKENGDLLPSSGVYCVKAYDSSFQKTWERIFPLVGQSKERKKSAIFSFFQEKNTVWFFVSENLAMDFSEQASALALATDDQTFLLTPEKNI